MEVSDFRITKDSAKELIKQMKASGGFTAKKMAEAVGITQHMLEDEQSLNFLSFPADLVATGQGGH